VLRGDGCLPAAHLPDPHEAAGSDVRGHAQLGLPPLPNVLTGCSVGHQDAAEWRRPAMHLVADLGWRTWVSYEPALGLVDWDGWEWIEWLVAGSESGYGARAADAIWFEVARAWCEKNDVAFFMKQILLDGRKLTFDRFPVELRVRQYPA
jgi:protein gp37